MPDSTDLLPEPTPPLLPGIRVVRPSADEAIDAVCADLFLQARGCAQTFGDVHLAFEPTPRVLAVVMRLMVDPLYRELPWSSAHVWITADGPHPPDDERSGFAELAGLLGEHAGIPPGQLHAIGVGEPRADEAYEAELRRCLSHRDAGHGRLDFVVTALDERAGVGGLVEGAAEAPAGTLAIAASSDAGPRVSLTLGTLNAARCVAVVATGAELSDALGRVVRGEGVGASVAPLAGEHRWYLDHDACAPGAGEQNA
ncbi:MAG: hypothetical protein DHS20C14_13880 [Phycisphaeraceae bacterium]|nr:MAG: hypothetical protein DHS20C14_13880 [Phycisphaeraceae bacterium]